jgi:hypothetical protein
MRYIFGLIIFLVLATAAQARQDVHFFPNDISSVVIKSADAKPDVSMLVEPILNRVYTNRNRQYNFDDSQIGSPASAFFSSLFVPGSGQITQKNWWRAGLFMAIEVTGVYLAVSNRNRAVNGERSYEQFINNNWSVVEYSNWLINYHEVNGINNPFIDELKNVTQGRTAEFNNQTDWNAIPISLLRNVERNTPFITSDQQVANNFSHTLPDYGSQQYYELVAKYFQFQGGWRDFNQFHDNIGNTGLFFNERFIVDRTGATASTFFFDAADMASSFNQDYRDSRIFTSIIIANHIISAFDSYFSFRLKQKDLQLSSSIAPGQQISLSYRFN